MAHHFTVSAQVKQTIYFVFKFNINRLLDIKQSIKTKALILMRVHGIHRVRAHWKAVGLRHISITFKVFGQLIHWG